MVFLDELRQVMGQLKPADDTKLGWMDDAPYSKHDRERVMRISGQTYGTNHVAIRAILAGLRGSVTRRDFELMRQDRRRAQAAYPDVSSGDLFTAGWINVGVDAKIPTKFCTSGNSSGTLGKDGEWYLDGGCFTSFVRAQYPNRADAVSTAKYFSELRAKHRAEKLNRLKEGGPFYASSGTGGSMWVYLDEKTNEVVVGRADSWASKGTEYRFSFVIEDWVDVNVWDLDSIKKMPSFAMVVQQEIAVQPSGVMWGSQKMR